LDAAGLRFKDSNGAGTRSGIAALLPGLPQARR